MQGHTIMIRTLKLPKINLPDDFYHVEYPGFRSTKKSGYYSYHVKKKIKEKVKALFPANFFNDDVKIMAQIMDSGVDGVVHKDVSRVYAINYMLNTGGKDAHLGLYNEDKELIDTYKQVPGEWCLLDTQKYHAIREVISKRISLTIQFFRINKEQQEWINAQLQNR